MYLIQQPQTIVQLIKQTSQVLLPMCQNAIHAKQEAKWLLQKLLGCSLIDLVLEGSRFPPEQVYSALEKALKARIQERQPFSRHFQERFFWKEIFLLNESTLDPRIETESLVEAVLQSVAASQKENPLILDLGTGSGCILLSLLQELPKAFGYGSDISSHALLMAEKNASRLCLSERCQWIQSDWFEEIEGLFDYIVSNPPYIPEAERAQLSLEVLLWDPERALFGGQDGLYCYRLLAAQLVNYLKPEGHVFLEIGYNQAGEICQLLTPFFKQIQILQDLFGKDRIIWACDPKK